MKKISGVYMLKDLNNGKMYIGATAGDILKRCKAHLYKLKYGTHSNIYLQDAWNSGNNFAIIVLEECGGEKVETREEYWIALYDSNNREKGYNIESGGKNKGKTRTEETRVRMSISMKKSIQKSNDNILKYKQGAIS